MIVSYLCIEVVLEALELSGEPLVRVRKMLGLHGVSLLESLVDICLNVVLMELRFSLFVFLEGPHVSIDSFLLHIKCAYDSIVVLLLFQVLGFDLLEPLSKRAQLLDLWCQLGLLLLYFSLDLLNNLGHLLERMRLLVIELLFEFRDALNVVFNIGVSSNTLLLFELLKELVDVLCTGLEDALGPIENLALRLDLV